MQQEYKYKLCSDDAFLIRKTKEILDDTALGIDKTKILAEFNNIWNDDVRGLNFGTLAYTGQYFDMFFRKEPVRAAIRHMGEEPQVIKAVSLFCPVARDEELHEPSSGCVIS